MWIKTSSVLILLCVTQIVYAAVGSTQKAADPVSYQHVLNWSLGLVIVLCLIFACLWVMRKTGALPNYSKQNMQVINALSLGMREKLIVVQVGDKQLVLGVTPGRIDKLLVLEGSEQIDQKSNEKKTDGDFAAKLKQLMAGTNHE